GLAEDEARLDEREGWVGGLEFLDLVDRREGEGLGVDGHRARYVRDLVVRRREAARQQGIGANVAGEHGGRLERQHAGQDAWPLFGRKTAVADRKGRVRLAVGPARGVDRHGQRRGKDVDRGCGSGRLVVGRVGRREGFRKCLQPGEQERARRWRVGEGAGHWRAVVTGGGVELI